MGVDHSGFLPGVLEGALGAHFKHVVSLTCVHYLTPGHCGKCQVGQMGLTWRIYGLMVESESQTILALIQSLPTSNLLKLKASHMPDLLF